MSLNQTPDIKNVLSILQKYFDVFAFLRRKFCLVSEYEDSIEED